MDVEQRRIIKSRSRYRSYGRMCAYVGRLQAHVICTRIAAGSRSTRLNPGMDPPRCTRPTPAEPSSPGNPIFPLRFTSEISSNIAEKALEIFGLTPSKQQLKGFYIERPRQFTRIPSLLMRNPPAATVGTVGRPLSSFFFLPFFAHYNDGGGKKARS